MKPHTRTAQTAEMFRPRLDEQLNMKHPLIRLAGLMDWELIEHHFAGHFTSGRGRPALPPRLVAAYSGERDRRFRPIVTGCTV